MHKGPSVGLGLLLVGALTATVSASLMLRTQTTIPLPEPGQEIPLEKLAYKARFEAKVSSVRLELRSSEGSRPLEGEWIFTGSNTDGQVHRIEMELRLRDAAGKQIGFFSAKNALAAGARDQKFSVPMKVAPDVWKAAKSVLIVGNWIA